MPTNSAPGISDIRTGLIPVIRKRERFDFVAAKDRLKQYLSNLLILTDNERDFLSSFRNGSYRPELLFEGEILTRIKDHPMAAWKMAQMRRNSSNIDHEI